MWLGVAIIAVAVVLVGLAAPPQKSEGDAAEGAAIFGVLVTLTGTFVQAVQYVSRSRLT
jgi:drug/metabolite transporter (DMT)-like permease